MCGGSLEDSDTDECCRCSTFKHLEAYATRVVTLRETFEYGFKAGLSKAGLTSDADASYKDWIWSREKK